MGKGAVKDDLTGRRFGRWVVLGRSDKRCGNHSPYWLCRCDCGTLADRQRGALTGGHSTGCKPCAGKARRKCNFRVGDKYGQWTVLEIARRQESENGFVVWMGYCQCDCGVRRWVPRVSDPGMSRCCSECRDATREPQLTEADLVERAKKAEYARKWRANNPDKVRERQIRSRDRNAKQARRRRAANPTYRLAQRLRCRLRYAIRRACVVKSAKTRELIGCEWSELKSHIEANFEPGMSWENVTEWDVDHIRPCASFDLSDPEQQRQCFHWSNLRPMWSPDNSRKGSLYEGKRHRYHKPADQNFKPAEEPVTT